MFFIKHHTLVTVLVFFAVTAAVSAFNKSLMPPTAAAYAGQQAVIHTVTCTQAGSQGELNGLSGILPVYRHIRASYCLYDNM